MPKIVSRLGSFYSNADEENFFGWLQCIASVSKVVGKPDGLHVSLSRSPTDKHLRQLIAILYRYDFDITPLAAFLSDRNRTWFADPGMFWHQGVFGRGKPRRARASSG